VFAVAKPSMKSARCAQRFLALLLVLAFFPFAGCGRAGTGAYVVRVGAGDVGSVAVTVKREGGGIVYTETENRPYLEHETTIFRRLDVSSGYRLSTPSHKYACIRSPLHPLLPRSASSEYSTSTPRSRALQERRIDALGTTPYLRDGVLWEYYAGTRVPGAWYRTRVKVTGGSLSFFQDGLQTFDYFPSLGFPGGLLPLEPDSACLMQAQLDTLIASGKRLARTAVVVPSRGNAYRDTVLERVSDNRVKVSVGGIGEFRLRFDKNTGRLLELKPAGKETAGEPLLVEGSADIGPSEPFQPDGRGYAGEEVRVPARGRRELSGSLYVPGGKPPYRAVVLAGDVGPQDRTGVGLFSQVADRLARSGMAVLTCDKRGVPGSEGAFRTYTLDSAVQDLNSEIDFLLVRGNMDVDRLGVVGIGEGGVIASKAAVDNPYITAGVFMATPAVRLFPDLARLQVEEAGRSGELTPGEVGFSLGWIDTLVGAMGSTVEDSVKAGGQEVFLGWMRSHMKNDPAANLAALTIPVLVVQGGADPDVPQDQAGQLMRILEARGRGGQWLAFFEKLGHGFGPLVGEAEARPDRSHPRVEQEVLYTVARWLKEELDVR